MEKITLTKKIYYYMKDELQDIQEVKKQQFDNIDDALAIMKGSKLKYVDNPKGLSMYEGISILYKQNNETFKRYSKNIDIYTKEEKTTAPSEKEEEPEKEILTLKELLHGEVIPNV